MRDAFDYAGETVLDELISIEEHKPKRLESPLLLRRCLIGVIVRNAAEAELAKPIEPNIEHRF